MNNNFNHRNSVTTYVVQKGDNLYSISKKFNTTPATLMTLNHLSNTLLNIGQVLIVKKEEEGIPEHIGIDLCGVYEEEVSDPVYDLYTVQKNDSLYSIAKNYQTTVANLMYLNNLNNNLLSLGQQLKVPHHATTIDYYVKAGDTLYSIASNYNVTPKRIITVNQLDTTSLVIGQLLKIPTASSTNGSTDSITYTVQKGDSLYSISKKFNTTVDKIKQENHLKSNILSINQTLIIPQ